MNAIVRFSKFALEKSLEISIEKSLAKKSGIRQDIHESASHIKVRKNLDFMSSDTPKYWFGGDPFKTRFIDSLQLTFPDGERYFIESVRAYRDDIKDEKLKLAVKDFIMQEAQHGIAHEKINQRLKEQGMPIDGMINFIKNALRKLSDDSSKEFNIANTAATEHLTALMAKCFFENKKTTEGIDPYMRALMAWHAIEEMEHRAVCFDVMKDVADVSERTRYLAMLQTSILLPIFTLARTEMMLKADGFSLLQRLNMFQKGLPWIFGKNGILAPVWREYKDWYSPNFHPDNHPMIHSYPAWVKVFSETNDPIKAGHALWEAGFEAA